MRHKFIQNFPNRTFQSSLTSSFLVVLFCLRFSHCIDPQTTPLFEESELASALLTSNGTCSQVVSGLHKLRLGVDITKLDLLPLIATANDGFKYPVIDFSCEEGKTKLFDGIKYDMPDQVISITDNPKGNLRSEVYIFKGSDDVLKVMSANVGLDSITKGFFTASASYKRMASKIYNESHYIEYIVSRRLTRTAKLVERPKLKLGKYVQTYVNRLLPNSFENDPEKYFRFIKYFGTHYFPKLYFGGTLQFYLETQEDYHHDLSDSALEKEVRATFFNFLKTSGSYKGPLKRVDPYFKRSTNKIIRYYGQNTNISAEDGISHWQSTISKNPWIVGGQLKPISDLIDDKSKRKSMEKATQIHIDEAYIDSLMDLLNWVTKKYARFHQQISAYKDQVKTLNASDHNAVIKLGTILENELKIPSWFLNNYKLCFKWTPDTGGGQCDSGSGRYLCAEIGSMTPYYKDDTNKLGHGCRMQWGIQNPEHVKEHWLRQIKLCFRWRPDGIKSQCADGAVGTFCASVNIFTAEYRDNTDGRDGGCRMQWRLVVPDDAPIWYRSLKLCLEWYTVADKDQCGGEAHGLLCATNDSWTAAYRDNTDRRNGGCYMRWGIITS